MFDFSLQQLLLRFAGLLLVVTFHGYVLALVARLLGDRGPEYDGRKTLSPLAHLDAIGALGLLFFSLGWIKPLDVDPEKFRKPYRDLIILTVAGILANVAFALLLRVLRPLVFTTLPDSIAFGTLALFNTAIALNLWFVIFNLLPIPPLTLGQLLIATAPKLQAFFKHYLLYLKLVLGLVILTGEPTRVLRPLFQGLSRIILGG